MKKKILAIFAALVLLFSTSAYFIFDSHCPSSALARNKVITTELREAFSVYSIQKLKRLPLWVNQPSSKKSDIRCLCGKCLKDYMTSSSFMIKRLNPFERIKRPCDKCDGTGYEYIIYSKSSL